VKLDSHAPKQKAQSRSPALSLSNEIRTAYTDEAASVGDWLVI
jgi:hypothetical protein